MSRHDAHDYFHFGQYRPPIIPPQRDYSFVCKICQQPGVGRTPTTRTHDGACRAEAHRRANVRARLKKARVRARLARPQGR